MITNERQLQIARGQLARFEAELSAGAPASAQALVATAQREAIESQATAIRKEIEDFESLQSGGVSVLELGALSELPEGLIRARIAAGLTQKDLAARLGLKEQQIQRYEMTRYEGASFSRIREIADAIGLRISKRLELYDADTLDGLVKRLSATGLDAAFIQKRIAPTLTSSVEGVRQLANTTTRLFGWSDDQLFGSVAPDPPGLGAAMARFKMPKGRDARSVAIYTAYAFHLAQICARAMANAPREHAPANWKTFRARVLEKYGALDLRTALAFAWDLGVVVLPLSDPGAFHGACWRIDNVNVVVLKQSTAYTARWLFDLLHELFHAAQSPDAPTLEVVEAPETSDERRESKEEMAAMRFAGNVALDGQAETLAKRCVAEAGGDLRRLKRAAQDVSASEHADLSLLANYLAFRLSFQGENWWGAAANLQSTGEQPLMVARDAFFERFDFSGLDGGELELLTLALND